MILTTKSLWVVILVVVALRFASSTSTVPPTSSLQYLSHFVWYMTATDIATCAKAIAIERVLSKHCGNSIVSENLVFQPQHLYTNFIPFFSAVQAGHLTHHCDTENLLFLLHIVQSPSQCGPPCIAIPSSKNLLLSTSLVLQIWKSVYSCQLSHWDEIVLPWDAMYALGCL